MCIRGDVLAAAAYAQAFVKDATPPTTQVNRVGLNSKNNQPDSVFHTIVFAVPNGYYFQITILEAGVGSSVTMAYWCEVEL